jgi:hypothetical protein
VKPAVTLKSTNINLSQISRGTIQEKKETKPTLDELCTDSIAKNHNLILTAFISKLISLTQTYTKCDTSSQFALMHKLLKTSLLEVNNLSIAATRSAKNLHILKSEKIQHCFTVWRLFFILLKIE